MITHKELNQALEIKRRFERWPGTLDLNTLQAIQERVKVLDTAFQRYSGVLQAMGTKIPSRWIRANMPPHINADWAQILSIAGRNQRVLPRINYKGISNINLSAFTQPSHNSLESFTPYTDFDFGGNSQYPDNEEEPPDSATDGKSSVEHSGWLQNRQWQLGQDWIMVEVRLAVGITIRAKIPILLEELAQRWWEPVIWIVLERLS